ncbi:MAG: serine/threonine-protein kinase [Ktedonobacteraceae bacterium]
MHKRYMILRTIGQGGMGAVYQARDMRRGTICAIKEMSLSQVPPDERGQAIQNFRGEAKILSALNHPNLPTFTGLFNEGQRYFLVMEYIEGQTLEQLLEQNGPFPERRVLGWGRQLCDVLEYLHSQNPPIIFRDIKPGNIMLTHDGHIKLIDFGIARFFRLAGSRDTQMLGTPGFAPPEQYGKAQTDERSDIYSLAITLFQLLTNTLSEKGFGLKDVRSINPNISPNVARALEKASSLSPEDRYDSIASFRRALLGVGTFFFENGNQATTPEELAELSAQFPEEAADYLFSGEFESWFHEIGDFDLARSTKQIRMTTNDPTAAIERFLQIVMGPGAHIRGATGTINLPTSTITQSRARMTRSWLSRKPASDVVVEPDALDFGEVYPGMSAPLSLTISGNRGILVQGTISSADAWIVLDQTAFDGMSTRVNVRVNSMRLPGSNRYSGAILVKPDTNGAEEEKEQTISVKVRVEVLGNTTMNGRSRPGSTRGAPFDDDDTLIATNGTRGPVMTPQQQRAKTTQGASASTTQVPAYNNAKYNEYRAKYGRPGGSSNSASAGWDPLQATPKQRTWLQRGLTLFAAFMVASLAYTVIEQLLAPGKVLPLPPSAWFIVVLICIVPAATIGALLVNWSPKWSGRETLNRLCAGLSSVLAVLGVVEFVWQTMLQVNVPGLQLIVLLLFATVAAYFGITPGVSNRILSSVSWGIRRRSLRQLTIGGTLVIGGVLGFFLTAGFGVGLFTFLAVISGMLVMLALALRVDSLFKRHVP